MSVASRPGVPARAKALLRSSGDVRGAVPTRWTFACFATCIAIGVIAGVNPKYGILGALGLTFAVITMVDLTVGYVLFTVASFLDVISGTGSFSGTKVLGLVLFVSWLARAATRRGTGLGAFAAENPGLTAFLTGMLGWTALSFAWATSPGAALGGAGRLALDLMLIPIAYTAGRRRDQLFVIAAAFVLGAVMSGAYGILVPTASSGMDAGRLTGTLGESNAEGTVLAAAIPLLIGLAGVIRNSARLKLAALVAAVLLFAGLVGTLSREGLLSLGVVLVGAVLFGGRWRRKAAVLLVIGVTATVGYYGILAPATSLQRVTASDTSGRSSLWTVAMRVVAAHPLLGVGNDNFIVVEHQYINRPGAIQALFVINTPKYVHNAFLEAEADLGPVGLITLVGSLLLLLGSGIRAARVYERLGDEAMEMLARGAVLASLAVLTSDFFVSGDYAKYQWLVLAMCPAIYGCARRALNAERSRSIDVERA